MEKSSTCVASSSIVLQVGQCGNQIGPKFFKIAQSSKTGFIDNSNQTCRAVCVDTENKVVNYHNLEKGLKCKYRDGNLLTGHFGRGSNWAMGYNMEERVGYRGEDNLLDKVLNRVRLEAERSDCFCATLMLHSLSGGTGGGVGARLCEEIRDMFPNRYILSAGVAPFSCGENPMQWYNTLLCTSHLARSSDQVILLRNDHFSPQKLTTTNNNHNNTTPNGDRAATVSSANENNNSNSSLDLSHINQHFAFNLAGVLFPTDPPASDSSAVSDASRSVSSGMEISELVRSCCPCPQLRFTRLDGCFRLDNSSSFEKLLSSLGLSFKSSLHHDDVTSMTSSNRAIFSLADEDEDVPSVTSLSGCVSCVAVLRGQPQGFPKYDAVVKRLAFLKSVCWNPYPVDLWTSSRGILSKTCSSVTLCSNHYSSAAYLEKVWRRARVKFQHNAYLHWYERYECSRQDFSEAFNQVASIVNSYREAVAV